MSQAAIPARIRLAALPTPLERLRDPGWSPGGGRIWVKRDDLTGSGLGGNKVRKLEFSIAEALEQGADTLITCGGLQSNHCRATALAGARLGLGVHLVLRGSPAGPATGNLLLDHLAGARISTHETEAFKRRLDEILAGLVAEYAAAGHRAHIIPMGASDATGIWGYIEACRELRADIDASDCRPRHIICASGSGGTQAGLIVGNALHRLEAEVWGFNVCDDAAYFIAKIRSDMRAWRAKYGHSLDVDALPINIVEGYKGPGYGEATPAVRSTIARMARAEGLLLDPVYTGKAFHGLVAEMARGRFGAADDVLFVHTGGIFGLMAEANSFAAT